jgi:magnesium transporter
MEKRVQDYTQDILAVVRSNTSPAAMSDKLGDFHANDIADAMPRLTVQERCKLYRILELDMLSDIFEYTDSDNAAEYVKEMDVKKGAAILSRMETDALVEVLHKIDKAKKKLLFELMDDDVRHDIEMIASFDEDEIGSRMTTNCIIIRENLTVKQAMNSLVEQAAKNDNISTIFVVTESQKFYGAIDLKDLIIARQDKSLEDLVATSYPYVYAEEDIDDCIEELKAYSEDSIPVLDNDNRLLGVITSSNIIDLVDDEMGEDYAMLAGLTAEEDLKEPLKESMKKRMPWLIILLGLGMVVSSVVGIFEKVVTALPIIMCFQSLILDMAGNVGTQSLAVTIRVLTDEELTLKQQLGFVLKELKVGFFNGMIIGSISFMITGLFIWLAKGQTVVNAFAMSGCIGGALWLAMIISSVVGTIIPIFFTKIKVDPAVASGPLISTVNDLVAVVTYYGLAWTLLLNIVHMA